MVCVQKMVFEMEKYLRRALCLERAIRSALGAGIACTCTTKRGVPIYIVHCKLGIQTSDGAAGPKRLPSP